MAEIKDHPLISTNDVLRPTHLEICLNEIRNNYNRIREHVAPAKVMPILKANAYGHGLVRIAQLMQEIKADYIGVAVVEEGILLRELGISLPILVLGGMLGNQVPLFLKNDLTITASSIDKLKSINEAAEQMNIKARVHLKVDTGLERIGVHYYNAEKFVDAAFRCKNIIVEGIYSHFASSGSSDLSYTNLQLERFNDVLKFVSRNSYDIPIKHISNSGGILQVPEANFDMVRPGISLYGVYPSAEVKKTIELKPALKWKSLVVYFKVINPGHPVGYDSTWVSDKPVRAVTVPVGYGDGYFRSTARKAQVLLNGKRYPVIGTISMDQVVVNVEKDSAYNGDEVTLIGRDGENIITVEDMAEWAGTIPYEILTNINTRVPRLYL